MIGSPANRRRRVMVWLPALAESTGGIQSFSQELLRALLTNRARWSVDVFVKNDRRFPSVEKASDLRSSAFGKWPEGPIRTAIFAVCVICQSIWRRPDLIIVGHANFAGVAAWMSRLLSIPFWVILHGVEVWDERGERVGRHLRRADRLLAVSRFTRDKVARQRGIEENRFSLLPNTVDGGRFRPEPKSAGLREKLGVAAEARIILTVCRLNRDESYKGYDQILAALPEVKVSIPEAHFLLVGTGNDEARVQKEVMEKRLERCVTLCGFVPDAQLVDYFNLCDVFAMPSRGEGFGIVFLEALACGKPVIAGNGDGATDALCDGELGVLVDPDNQSELAGALIALLNGTHPHPIAFQPEEIRRRTLDYFGRKPFKRRLDQYLAESL